VRDRHLPTPALRRPVPVLLRVSGMPAFSA
jgi:hypothetical protein